MLPKIEILQHLLKTSSDYPLYLGLVLLNNSINTQILSTMNIFKSLVIFSLLSLGTIFSANAQDILSPEQKKVVIDNVNQFITDLNLSEADKPAFREIVGDFFIGIVALGATNYSLKTNRKLLKTFIKGRDSRMKDLLSKEQYKVYKARIKERRENLEEFMKQQQQG